MKWIVTDHQGKEHEATGGSASSAAMDIARYVLPLPSKNLDNVYEFKVKRKNAKPHEKEEIVVIKAVCYWSDDFTASFRRNHGT